MANTSITPDALSAVGQLQSKGWTKEQASGLVGNFQFESGSTKLNPAAVGDNGNAYGIAQWQPDRQADFKAKYGKPIQGSSVDEQIDFAHYELTQGKEQSAGNALKGTSTASEAAKTVMDKYERPSDLAKVNSLPTRTAFSNALSGTSPDIIAQRVDRNSPSMLRTATAEDIAKNGVLGGSVASDAVSKTGDPTSTNQAPLKFTETIPNPLLQYPSYTYGISLHLLTVDEYNKAVTKQEFTTNRVLIASGGRWSDSFVRDPNFTDDFYFENLDIETVIGTNAHSRSSNAVHLGFTIVEPYGITLINRLIYANATMTPRSENYIDQPYLLQIDFFAIDDAGVITGSLPKLQKRIPFKFTKLAIKASSKGAEYSCEAVPYNSSAFLVSSVSVPVNLSVDAGNLQSFFQSQVEDTNFVSQVKDERERASQNITKEKDTVMIRNNTADAVVLPLTMVSAKSKSNIDNANSDHPVYTVNSLGTGINAWYKSLDDSSKTSTHDTYAFKIHADILKKQEFVLKDKLPVNSTTMAKNKETANTQRKANIEDSDASALNFNGRTFSINAGTSIDKIIDFAMRQTVYLQEQITNIESLNEDPETFANKYDQYKNTPLKWYKVVPTVVLGAYDKARQQYSRVITYNIIPHKIYNCKSTAAPQGQVTTVMKEHNYLYTGKNDDVIDLNIEFNALFFNSVTAYKSAVSAIYNLGTEEPTITTSADDPSISKISPNAVQPMKTQYVVFNQQARATGGEVTAIQAALSDVEQSLYTASGAGGGDMIEAKLTILGDPHYIKQDEIFYSPDMSPTANSVDQTGSDPRLIADGSLHMDQDGVYLTINIRSPVDVNESNGMMDFQKATVDSVFSGLYQLIQVNSSFKDGKFIQTLQNVRLPNQPTQDINAKVTNTNREKGTVTTISPVIPDAPKVTVASKNTVDAYDKLPATKVPVVAPLTDKLPTEQQKLKDIAKNGKVTAINAISEPQKVVPQLASASSKINITNTIGVRG